MEISSVAATSVAMPVASSQTTPPSSPAAPVAETVLDRVEISVQAQAASASPPVTPPTWANATVSTALTALNDMSGKTAVADQISAFKTLAAMVADAKNFDPTKPQNTDAVDVAAAFASSAFVNHYRELMAQYSAFTDLMTGDIWGKNLSDVEQRQLNYFNSLSQDDQHILNDTHGASMTASGCSAYATTLDQHKARLQTDIDVNRAVEALVASPGYADEIAANQSSIENSSLDVRAATIAVIRKKAEADSDTQTMELLDLVLTSTNRAAKAQAYFDKYGPAPAQSDAEKAADAAAPLPPSGYKPISKEEMQRFFSDLATLTDAKGTATPQELVSAYKYISDRTIKAINSTIGDVVWLAGTHTTNDTLGYKLIADAENTYQRNGWMEAGGSQVARAQSYFKSFEHLDDFNQEIVAGLYGANARKYFGDGTIEGFRASLIEGVSNAAQSDAISALYQAENFGHLKADSTVTILGVKLNLNQIMASNDKRLDPYTRMSKEVKALLHEAAEKWAAGEKVSIDATKLGGVPPTDAEKALAALKAYMAGNGPKTEADKALSALKDGTDDASHDAALALLKESQDFTTKLADAKKATDSPNWTDQVKPDASDSLTQPFTPAHAAINIHT